MKKRTSYLLIGACILTFAILAPAIVFFVRGVRPGLSASQYRQTGILVVNSQPSGAKVFLNDAERGTTPSTIRFLTPGEYNIAIKNPGYFDWTKRLEVKADKVTWAINNASEVSLIKQDGQLVPLAQSATSFVIRGSSLLYINGKNLITASVDHPERTDNLAIPRPVSRISEFADQNMLLLTGDNSVVLFSIGNRTFYDLTGIAKPDQHMELSPDGSLLVLHENSLLQINLKTKKQTTLLKHIAAFTVQNRDLYYLTAEASPALRTVPLSQAGSVASSPVFSGIPATKNPQIIISPQREIVLVLDNALYRVNGSLELIADDLAGWTLNPADDIITFTTAAELDYYSFADDAKYLVTRNTADIRSPFVSTKIGYAFFIADKQIHALELDARDHQNDYIVYSGDVPVSLTANDDLDTLYVQDSGTVSSLKVR
jgi:hypothetical protein